VNGTSGIAGQLSTNLLARYALTDGSGAPQDSSGNGNNATLPGGTLNPTWTTQGISCNGSSQYFNSTGTQSARTFVWVSTETPQTTGPSAVGPQFVTPFGLSDRSVFFGGNEWYGNQPTVVVNGAQVGALSNGTLLGTHVFALTLGTNTTTDPSQFYIDGALVSSATAMGAATGKATGAYQVCGTPTGAATYFPGSFYYFEAYSDEKTATQIAQESNTVKQTVQSRGVAFVPAQDATVKDIYLSIGDSLTNGHGVTPSSGFLTPTDSFDVVNYGLGGALTTDLAYMFDARDAALYRHNAGRNVIRLWAGTNDVGLGRTAQSALEGIRSYCRKAKAVGFQTIVSDMISRTGQDSNMQTLNTLLTTQDTGCDLVLDLASDARLGAVGAYANATYYQADGIHLTQTGQQNIVAPAETRAINLLPALKAQTTSPTVTAATYTSVDSDLYLPVSPAANSVAVTLPDCGFFTGISRSIKNVQSTGSNAVTVAPAAGELIDGSSTPIAVANGATLVLRSVVLNRTTAGCSWLRVSNN
jgi:lysophospholipase L1-like esterase